MKLQYKRFSGHKEKEVEVPMGDDEYDDDDDWEDEWDDEEDWDDE